VTDTRATERLLEYIAEQRVIAANWTTDPAAKDALEQIERAVTELQRRGDTLVRREDLRLLVEASEDALIVTDREAIDAALERIESALGGA
jgi:hypothetical protein